MNKFEGLILEDKEYVLNLPYHLAEADMADDLLKILIEFDFLQHKIANTNPQLVIEDYNLALQLDSLIVEKRKNELKLLQNFFRLSSNILAEDKTQLATQLWARLKDFKITEIQELLEQAKQSKIIWLCPLSSSLTPPNGRLLRVLTGHRTCVNTVTVTPDGRRIISGADDGTLKVWDFETGRELFNLASDSAVTTVVITPDSTRVISGSKSGILQVWDLETGRKLFALGERDDIVKVIAITPDGNRVISTAKSGIREIPFFNKKYSEITQKTRDWRTVWNLGSIISSAKKRIRQNRVTVWDLDWNSNTIKRELTFKSSSPVTSIAVTPDGTQMIFGSFARREDDSWGTIIVQNLETGKKFTLNLPFHFHLQHGRAFDLLALPNGSNIINDGDIITAVAILDGKRVISGSIDATLTIWNLKTKKKQFTLTGHSKEITAIAIIPNENLAISGSKDKTLKIWNLKTKEEQFTLTGHSDEVTAVDVTPDGKYLISGSKDKTLKIWSLESEDEQFNTHQVNQQVNDNNQVKANSPNKIILRILLETICNGFNSPIFYTVLISGVVFLFSHNFFITIIFSFFIYFFVLFFQYVFISCFIFLLIQIRSSIKILIGVEVTDSFTVNSSSRPTSHSNIVNALTITPNGERAISTSDDKTLKVWNLETRKQLFTLSNSRNVINTIVTATNSSQLLFSSSNKTLNICNFEDLETILTFSSYSQKLSSCLRLCMSVFMIFSLTKINLLMWPFLFFVFSVIDMMELDYANAIIVTPDSNQVVSGCRDKTIKVWNLQKRKQLFTLKGHSDCVTAVAVTSDSRYLISGSRDKTIKVWNLQKRKQLFTLGNHESEVNTVCVTRDGNQVISGSRDKTIKVWDLQTQKEIFTIQGHSDSVESVVVTPDGKYLISASSDSTLKVWNLESREVIASFTGDSALCCCAIAPDGMTIVTGEASGQVHFLRFEGIEA